MEINLDHHEFAYITSNDIPDCSDQESEGVISTNYKRYYCTAKTQDNGRIYKDMDTGEKSPVVYNKKELESWYFNRSIVQALL